MPLDMGLLLSGLWSCVGPSHMLTRAASSIHCALLLQHSKEGVCEGVVNLTPCCIEHIHADLVPRQHQGAALLLRSTHSHTAMEQSG